MGKFYDEKKQAVVEGFYKELFSYEWGDMGYKLAAGIAEFVMCVFVWCLGAELSTDKEIWWLMFMASMFTTFVHMAFTQIQENGKKKTIADKLKYIPVSLREIKIYVFRKMMKIRVVSFIICLVGNVLWSIVGNYFSLWTLLMPIIVALVLPILYALLTICLIWRQ